MTDEQVKQLERNVFELGHATADNTIDNTIEVYRLDSYFTVRCGHCRTATNPGIGTTCCAWRDRMLDRYFWTGRKED